MQRRGAAAEAALVASAARSARRHQPAPTAAAAAASPEEEDGRSVMSVATSNWPMPTPSNHALQRAAEHGATQRQFQHTMKHGPVELSTHGTEDAPRLVHRGPPGGVDVVTDATGEVAITTHPARASQARARDSP